MASKVVLIVVILWQVFLFFRLPHLAWIKPMLEAWFVNNGLMFYRDFIQGYLPFEGVLMIPLIKIFGYEPAISVIFLVFFLFYLCRRWLGDLAATVALLVFVFWFSFISTNELNPNMIFGLLVLFVVHLLFLWIDSDRKKYLVILGILMGCSSLLHQQANPLLGILFVVIVFWQFKVRKRGGRSALNDGLIYIGSAALPFIPLLIWFVAENALGDVIFWNFTFYFKIYPFSASGKSIPDLIKFVGIHFPLVMLLMSTPTLKKTARKQAYLLICVFVSLVIPIWFAIFHPMRFQMSVPFSAFMVGWIVHQTRKSMPFRVRVFFVVYMGLVLYTALTMVLPYYRKMFREAEGRPWILNAPSPKDPLYYQALQWFGENTTREERIMVFSGESFYAESDRLPATKYTASLPWAMQPFEDFRKALKETPPDYWFVDERRFERFDEWGFAEMSSFIRDYTNCYDEVARFEFLTIVKNPGHPCVE